jgi:hypothetical protein
LGADHDDGLVGLEGQVEEVSRFLQGRRAVRNDKASELGPFGGEPMDDDGELQPFKRADGGAADAAERYRHNVGYRRDLGIAGEHLIDRQLGAEIRVVEHVHAIATERRDGAAAADGRNQRPVGHHTSEITSVPVGQRDQSRGLKRCEPPLLLAHQSPARTGG